MHWSEDTYGKGIDKGATYISSGHRCRWCKKMSEEAPTCGKLLWSLGSREPGFFKTKNRHLKVSKNSDFFATCSQWHIAWLCKFSTRHILFSALHKKDKSAKIWTAHCSHLRSRNLSFLHRTKYKIFQIENLHSGRNSHVLCLRFF